MTGINSDLAASSGRIAEIERRLDALHHRVAQHGADSAEARYAKTALDVLERSLKLMYLKRDRIEGELKRQQKEARRLGKRWYGPGRGPGGFMAHGARAVESRDGRKVRPITDREWQKRADV